MSCVSFCWCRCFALWIQGPRHVQLFHLPTLVFGVCWFANAPRCRRCAFSFYAISFFFSLKMQGPCLGLYHLFELFYGVGCGWLGYVRSLSLSNCIMAAFDVTFLDFFKTNDGLDQVVALWPFLIKACWFCVGLSNYYLTTLVNYIPA